MGLESGLALRRVVVAIDRERDLALVDDAIALAQQSNARLEIVCGLPTVWFTVHYAAAEARVCLEEDLADHARCLLRAAVARVPHDVCVTSRMVTGSAVRTLARTMPEEPGVQLLTCRPRRPLAALLAARTERRRRRSPVPPAHDTAVAGA